MIHVLDNGKQQIVADGNPYLRKDCILARSIERCDAQPLLCPFEETLHLPAFPVEFRDGQVGMGEVIGQESVDIVCGIVLIHHHSKRLWIPLGGFRTSEPYDGVADDTGLLVNRTLFHHLILHVVLGFGHEESLLPMEVVEQLPEVDVAFIHKVVASSLYRNQAHCLGVMYGSLGQVDEGRDRPTQVEQGVHLCATFVVVQACPRAELEAELDGTAVESINHAVNIKSGRSIFIQLPCPCNQNLAEVMVYTPVLGLIDMGKCGTLYVLDTTRIELGRQGYQRCVNAAEAHLLGELCKAHHHKLVSAFEPDGMSVAIVSLYAFVELISWHERHYLSEYCLSLIHDSCLLQYYMQKNEIKSRKFCIRVNH